ncbi:MAG TPA: SDR family NAD(P)-dependent oxidoreductase [Candidatus Binatia bacterium]|nr:SDR family NAD(P)-dependent oxidoreductase [Candidatus Binatia bacterium]
MAGRLEGKVAVITGGGSGIGRDTVLRFLAEGAAVVASDINERTGNETIELAGKEGHGSRVVFQKTDVSSEEQVVAMIERAVREFGRLDCVFNNAGFPGALGKIHEIDADKWDQTFAVLVKGVFLGTKHAARIMLEHKIAGSIINTGSVAGLTGGCGPVAYSACKAAVVNMTRAVAVQLARKNIRANTVCPGGILTPLVHRGNEEAMEGVMAAAQPMKVAGRGTDIAAACVFLASDDARFVTGTEIVVDGGLIAAGPHIYKGEFEAQFPGGMDRGTTEM